MAYSLIELQTLDIDVFFSDSEKRIHLASAGGSLPKLLVNNNINNNAISNLVREMPLLYEFEINPNLGELLNLNSDDLIFYLSDFITMAKRGFYSYDKSQLGNFDGKLFHLVAWPTGTAVNKSIINVQMLKIKKTLPKNFKPFNIFNYFGLPE